MRVSQKSLLLSIMMLSGSLLGADEVVTGSNSFSVDMSPDGKRIVMDLQGDIWILSARGGEAKRLVDGDVPLRRPRWSPNASQILYHSSSADGTGLWVVDVATRAPRRIGIDHRQDGSWHPDGERIVFAAQRHDTGLDIWETDLPTGLSWRLSDHPADEFDPVWSDNGRHLAWIRRFDNRYELILRRQGEQELVLVESDSRLAVPSWRPDGSLLTFQRYTDDGIVLEMVILSEPVLIRQIGAGENMIAAPVSWRDRMNMLYTANQSIRIRGFENRRSRPLHFRARVSAPAPPPPPPREIARRELVVTDAPEGRLIVRGARLFDGIWKGYRQNMDVVIEGGRVVAIEARRDRDDGTVLDIGNVTIIPGLVDAYSRLPASLEAGPAVLAYGVTTIVTDRESTAFQSAQWERESTPGPRLLYVDKVDELAEISSIADAGSPGISSLLDSRQARALGHNSRPPRRFSAPPDVSLMTNTVVAGSRRNQLVAGQALHAELRALQAAGLSGEQALHAAGRNPAVILGLENQVGTIIPGALADLVLVNGDPLNNITDVLNIVAIVRNGRFFSLVSVLEMATSSEIVE